MTANVTDILAFGVLGFLVVMVVLQLLLALWEGRKPAASNRSE